MNEFREHKHIHQASRKKRSGTPRWPNRLLALLVLGSCLFIGISSAHLLVEDLRLWDPLDPATYAQLRDSLDADYTQRLFSRPQPAASSNGGSSGVQAGPGPQQNQEGQPNTQQAAEDDNPIKKALLGMNAMASQALGARELNGVIKLDNGYITATLTEKQDLSHQVNKTVEFSQFVEEQGKRFVFVMAPHLIDKYDPMLPTGHTDYHNEMADEFLAALAEAGVASIDVRELMHEAELNHYGGFFRTDHHWKPETAAWATDAVMRELEEWGWLDTGGITTTPEDFETAHEPVSFYGTAAERASQAFAGEADSMNCIVPTQDAAVELHWKHFEKSSDEYSSEKEFEVLYRDWQYAEYDKTLEASAYYLNKTMYENSVMNAEAPIKNHLMLVCDSFGVPFQSFAACYMEEVTAFEGRWHVDFAGPVQQSDIVMVLYNPSSLDIRTDNQTIFEFR